jgi:hypothetical protein
MIFLNNQFEGKIKMKKLFIISITVLVLGNCSSPDTKQAEQDMAKPINCATAEGDIRALKAEKAHTSQQIEAGVTSIVPIGAVVHLLKGTEGETFKVATGDYNDALDKRITEIEQQCNIK